ncbi:MAG: hypothetical protein ABS35_23955 [Kaistia sp. SCN 65-12]|nr:MAG: hypothetical protein ABS35_23955 [Kaistia sp. SCN 65-12]
MKDGGATTGAAGGAVVAVWGSSQALSRKAAAATAISLFSIVLLPLATVAKGIMGVAHGTRNYRAQ